jgi:hypothetical protein
VSWESVESGVKHQKSKSYCSKQYNSPSICL